VKHLLWHGNAEEALERLGGLIVELDLHELAIKTSGGANECPDAAPMKEIPDDGAWKS